MTRLLLIGAGHAHAQVLLEWARAPVPGVELTLVSPQAEAPYSGMVPGWLAGIYRYDEICIRFAPLARAAGADCVADELASVDPDGRTVTLASGRTLTYDLLSINVGSTLTPPAGLDVPVLALRPLAGLRDRWHALLQRWQDDRASAPANVTMVGGGAAGVESMLAALARLRDLQPQRRFSGRLVARSTTLLEGLATGAAHKAERALQRAGVTLRLGGEFGARDAESSDLVLWATGAEAQAWQRDAERRGTLAVNELGFIQIDERLRSSSHPNIFAAGDCAAWQPPLPKAGVFAVRMGPVLAHNLRMAALGAGGALRTYSPQRGFLVLLGTADGRAIASRGRFSAEGRCLWRWKDHIDRSFLRRYNGRA
jgi:pyridine nucleotide-disulfide oxidoreductase family protein